MRNIALVLGLSLAPAFSTVAFAAPQSSQNADVKQGLTDTAKDEQQVMNAIYHALDEMNPMPVSDSAKSDYDASKALESEAETLWQGKQYKQAYMKFREAADKVQPALSEVLALPSPPQDVLDAGSALVQLDANRLDLLSHIVESKGSPAAKSAYNEAKTLYQDAKTQWTAGNERDASEKAWASLKKADVAVREMWQANTSK